MCWWLSSGQSRRRQTTKTKTPMAKTTDDDGQDGNRQRQQRRRTTVPQDHIRTINLIYIYYFFFALTPDRRKAVILYLIQTLCNLYEIVYVHTLQHISIYFPTVSVVVVRFSSVTSFPPSPPSFLLRLLCFLSSASPVL